MDQTEARKLAAQVNGLAVTRDRWEGRWEKTHEWGVGVGGFFYDDVEDLREATGRQLKLD